MNSPQTSQLKSDGADVRRVVVADDDMAVREALVELLTDDAGLVVVGAGADANEAIRLCLDHQPAVLVVDVNMPFGGGERAAKVLTAALPDLFVIALSANSDRVTRRKMAEAGAQAFLAKGDLGNLIHLVLHGLPTV